MRKRIAMLVDEALSETLKMQDKIPHDIDYKNSDVQLFGQNGILDSISLVSLIVSIEGRIQEALQIDILLVNDKALSKKNSPFKNHAALINYVETMVQSS